MLAYPWVVESGLSVTENMDYFFSDARPMYTQLAVEVYDLADHYLGYTVFSVSQQGEKTILKTRDFCFEQPSYERAVMALALRYGKAFNVTTIEISADIAIHIPGRLKKVLLQPKERIYQCMPMSDNSPLARLWEHIDFHLWDGDMAFGSGDLVFAFSDGGYEQGPLVAAVPEPSSLVLVLLGLFAFAFHRWRK